MRRKMGDGEPNSKTRHFDDAALICSDLACVRGGRMLFRGLDLNVQPGQVWHVTGPNGIGKSSLIRIVAGLLKPFSGTVDVNGTVALSDERLALDLHLPLRSALRFWARLDSTPDETIEQAMAVMQIAPLADIPVRIFSTGQRKRASLARVLAMNVPIWLLDEPSNGLDSGSLTALAGAIENHRAKGGIVFVASHVALPVADAQFLNLPDYVPC